MRMIMSTLTLDAQMLEMSIDILRPRTDYVAVVVDGMKEAKKTNERKKNMLKLKLMRSQKVRSNIQMIRMDQKPKKKKIERKK